VTDPLVLLPIYFREQIEKLTAVGRQLRISEAGDVDEIDDGHRLFRLSPRERGEKTSDNSRYHCCESHKITSKVR